jgi:hypothetical protein
MANWKHGFYSKQALAERRRIRELLADSEQLLAGISRNGHGAFDRGDP